jgi:hypothetical protein
MPFEGIRSARIRLVLFNEFDNICTNNTFCELTRGPKDELILLLDISIVVFRSSLVVVDGRKKIISAFSRSKMFVQCAPKKLLIA